MIIRAASSLGFTAHMQRINKRIISISINSNMYLFIKLNMCIFGVYIYICIELAYFFRYTLGTYTLNICVYLFVGIK